jgi:hypothetical protein
VNAASGTIVSFDVLTAAPADAELLPLAASAFSAALRAESDATDAAVALRLEVVPAGKFDVCVPLAAPADVLTQISFSVTGLCQ